MTSVGAAPKIVWRFATVIDVVHETPEAYTLTLDVPGWPGHRAGQHVDVRLTAEDGYQTERSSSERYGETSPSSRRSTVSASRESSGGDAME